MKRPILYLLFLASFNLLLAQDSNAKFDQVQCLDNSNKLLIDLKAKDPQDVVVLEKDYIVSSERVKSINARFTEADFNDGLVLQVQHTGMESFSLDWLELIKVLINDKEVLKVKEYEEGIFLMLVGPDFDQKALEKVAQKALWPIQVSTFTR